MNKQPEPIQWDAPGNIFDRIATADRLELLELEEQAAHTYATNTLWAEYEAIQRGRGIEVIGLPGEDPIREQLRDQARLQWLACRIRADELAGQHPWSDTGPHPAVANAALTTGPQRFAST